MGARSDCVTLDRIVAAVSSIEEARPNDLRVVNAECMVTAGLLVVDGYTAAIQLDAALRICNQRNHIIYNLQPTQHTEQSCRSITDIALFGFFVVACFGAAGLTEGSDDDLLLKTHPTVAVYCRL